MRSRPGQDEEAANAHWSLVSTFTMMNAEHRQHHRVATRQRWRLKVGLALVRLGLNVAPLTVADIAGEWPQADAR